MSKEEAPNFSNIIYNNCSSCIHYHLKVSRRYEAHCNKYDFELPNSYLNYRCDSWEGE